MKKHIYVRPLEGTTGWEVVKATPLEAFFHDLFWHGPIVAFGNLVLTLERSERG